METYAPNNATLEKDADMMLFNQPSNKLRMEYTEALRNKVLRFDRVYDENVMKGIFRKVYRNPSAIVCVHIGVLKTSLHYMT